MFQGIHNRLQNEKSRLATAIQACEAATASISRPTSPLEEIDGVGHKRELEAKLKLEDLIDQVRRESCCFVFRFLFFFFLFLCLLFCFYYIGFYKCQDETYAQRISHLLESVETLNIVYRFDQLMDKVSVFFVFFWFLIKNISHLLERFH